MADTKNPDPAQIEDEVRRTQDEIGDTIDELQEKMNPREVARSLVGDDNADLLKEGLDITRTNPIPVALIAVGLIWLLAGANTPTMRRIRERVRGSVSGDGKMDLRPRSEEPAPIGPPPAMGESFDRRA